MAIYIHDEAASLRLRVTGDLDEVQARELASGWRTASSVVGGRKVTIDLRAVAAAGDAGRELLEVLLAAGAEFMAASPFQLALVAEVTGTSPVKKSPADRPTVGGW